MGSYNDFWWCLQNVAKGIWRDELPYAKQMFEHIIRPHLDEMISWWVALDELVRIFNYICSQNDYFAEEQAIDYIRDLLQKKLNEKDDHFSNGRLVRNLFDYITLNQSKRLSKLSGHIAKESLMLITKEDVPQDS